MRLLDICEKENIKYSKEVRKADMSWLVNMVPYLDHNLVLN